MRQNEAGNDLKKKNRDIRARRKGSVKSINDMSHPVVENLVSANQHAA